MKPKTVVAVIGLPTSGKSTLGRALAEATELHFIDIDDGPTSCAPSREENPYGSKASRIRERQRMAIAYKTLNGAIEANLFHGFSIIISACYPRESYREILAGIVRRAGGCLRIIWCQYSDSLEEVERRVGERVVSNSSGGCRSISHYLDDKSRYEDVKMPHVVIMMDGGKQGLEKALDQALAHIGDER